MPDVPPSPADPPAKEAGRAEVLAWMAASGNGYKRAAAHFGMPPERVKQWDRRARKALVDPPPAPAPRVVAPPPKPSAAPRDSAGRFPPREPRIAEAPLAALTVSDVAALSPLARQDIRRGTAGITMYIGSVLPQVEHMAAIHQRRQELHAGGKDWELVDEVLPPPRGPNMRDLYNATQALLVLTKIAPHLDALDAATGGETSGAPSTTEVERVRASMLGPSGPSQLRIVTADTG